MPRSNRPRRPTGRAERNPAARSGDTEREDEGDLTRVLYGGQHLETRHGRSFTVQTIAGTSSTKVYICPGCSLGIEPGTRHIVAWRGDGLFGEENDLAERRHWHTHCWRIS